MKKNLTKLMALGLVVVMGATAAVGCGSKDSGSKTKDGKTKLTFGMWSETQMANMQAMIDEYEEQNPNVEIELQSSSVQRILDKIRSCCSWWNSTRRNVDECTSSGQLQRRRSSCRS